ncbi:cell envelope biogenesis protein TolA [Stutzerimonas stutzeri]|jgi:colicin import membrane protein|uniref:cell envelope integrity protein TolA n=1 Tax=Stutzerimonas stutzeri subgroup TaxID=578833 RepID=UPI0006278E46|nr:MULTISPECIES: cell envelope integrity protein TolA [Stutzerimonas stutzeri subgroup]KKJ96821.1 cell envelope biogenesis protein TolA [Stutzerimonas stutzeri]MAF87857.1 protein TolA [Pseudomonas sp.]MAK85687.1 protein TolA [Pseudomonas sp.]MBD3877472.1 cell envelope integrity protein TolA [Stutzerimonas kunmingensis]UEG62818.1 cell envelope integrity protein TolA [Stutzerimonas chloritidismutans]|tara:strand:+ start:12437 stop:13438 length:1002 start_codon:yes stop_codon:yes gene_type:complete
MQQRESSPSQSYFWPTVLAVGLHVIIFGMLFVSFSMTPELPPSKPIVQATLYQLKSQSQATTQTNQKIAGEAKKTAAKQFESEQMEQRKVEQQKQAAATRAAEQKKAEEARKADAAKAAADKAAAAKKAEEAKKVEQQKQADIAKKKTAEELAKKKAAEEAKKKAAEEAKRKAVEEAKKKAAAEAAKKKAAEDAKKKAAAEAARKAAEDKKAQALAELLSDTTERQQALADTHGDQVAGNFDDLIRLRAAEGWTRPPSARNNMTVQLQVNMLPDGTITNVSVSRSSGDVPFDNSAVAAVKNIGRLTEMQGLSPQDFQPYRSFKMTFTPEDLAL